MLLPATEANLIKTKRRGIPEHQGSFFFHCILCAIAGMIMGVAAVFLIVGGYGADPMNTLLQGMSHVLHLSVDNCNTLLSLMFVLAALFIDRKQIHVGTLLFPIMTTIAMRMLMPLIQADTSFVRVILAILGVVLVAFSIALSIYADCGKSPYDCITFGIMKLSGLQYHKVRWILDGTMLVIGVLFQGNFGFVTILNLFILGKLITVLLNKMYSIQKRYKEIQLKEEIAI